MPNTTTTANAFLSGSMTSLKSRRPSMLTSSNASVHSTHHHLSGANTSGILQQLGTGVVSCKVLNISKSSILITHSCNKLLFYCSTNSLEDQSKPGKIGVVHL